MVPRRCSRRAVDRLGRSVEQPGSTVRVYRSRRSSLRRRSARPNRCDCAYSAADSVTPWKAGPEGAGGYCRASLTAVHLLLRLLRPPPELGRAGEVASPWERRWERTHVNRRPRSHRYASTRLVSVLVTAVHARSSGLLQNDYSEGFNEKGRFKGLKIDDIAGRLKSGEMSVRDVPINVIVRDGHVLITNTRSAHALTRAGIPRESWHVVNQTGDPLFERLLSGQLRRNGLSSEGTRFPSSTGYKSR